MRVVTLYTRPECPMCRDAEALLARIGEKTAFSLEIVNIDEDQHAHDRYFDRIPVVLLDGQEVCSAPLDEGRLRRVLAAL